MRWGERLGSWLFTVLAVCIVAGIAHILSVLLMPALAPRDGYARLAMLGGDGVMTLLERASPERQVLPMLDPAVATGFCRYDLAAGPLRLRAGVDPDRFMSFSFHGRDSTVYYAMTDRAAARGRINVLVLTSAQLERVEAADEDDAPPAETRLLAPVRAGFVLVRAIAPLPSDLPQAEAAVRAVTCEVERVQ